MDCDSERDLLDSRDFTDADGDNCEDLDEPFDIEEAAGVGGDVWDGGVGDGGEGCGVSFNFKKMFIFASHHFLFSAGNYVTADDRETGLQRRWRQAKMIATQRAVISPARQTAFPSLSVVVFLIVAATTARKDAGTNCFCTTTSQDASSFASSGGTPAGFPCLLRALAGCMNA